jgi:hypothetical protein
MFQGRLQASLAVLGAEYGVASRTQDNVPEKFEVGGVIFYNQHAFFGHP